MRKAVLYCDLLCHGGWALSTDRARRRWRSDQVSAGYLAGRQASHARRGLNAVGRRSAGQTVIGRGAGDWTRLRTGAVISTSQDSIRLGNTQFTWGYTMVGHAPFGTGTLIQDWSGETTRIGAPIVPVNLDLRNFDGTPRFVNGQRLFSDATQFVPFVLASPVYLQRDV